MKVGEKKSTWDLKSAKLRWQYDEKNEKSSHFSSELKYGVQDEKMKVGEKKLTWDLKSAKLRWQYDEKNEKSLKKVQDEKMMRLRR